MLYPLIKQFKRLCLKGSSGRMVAVLPPILKVPSTLSYANMLSPSLLHIEVTQPLTMDTWNNI